MSKQIARELVADVAVIHREICQPVVVDRSFELPKALYIATAALYFGFLVVMGVGLATPGLIVPLAICAIFFAMFFAVPAVWTRMNPANPVATLSWQRFQRDGIATLTGRLRPREAAVQMLVLPVLVFLWGIVCVTIAALV